MNRLAYETSPYLLQHQNNPVDWYPWGPEALARAKAEDKPIFLSIGYSACHWCHVMEHESFEHDPIAALMNQHFVNIKVDREERPDIDAIYMNAVQLLTGRGGWPMSMFLTPSLQPFYGGTYYPPTNKQGMPGFDQVLLAVADAWHNRRDQALAQAAELTKHLQSSGAPAGLGTNEQLTEKLLFAASAALERNFDPRHGGFGGAPKFPHPMDIRLLLRIWKRMNSKSPAPKSQASSLTPPASSPQPPAPSLQPQASHPQPLASSLAASVLQMATHTLDKMAAGGMFDQLGGGFHRYSVDERWLVPHFEKMLYDNALLIMAYLEGYLASGNADFSRVVRETADYILRDMTDPAGGFYSTEDADSEGHEGTFYVWTPEQIEQLLGSERATVFCYVYDVSDSGNFEGENILNLPKSIEQCAKLRGLDPDQLREHLAEDRAKLFAARESRIRPGRDDKVLVAWNGLMIDALSQAANVLDEPRYLQAATASADFILTHMRRPDGRLLHTWRAGQAKLDAFLDDYACLINGLVSLYEAGFDERYIEAAVELAGQMITHFGDAAGDGFFFTADDHEQLISRQKDIQDSATPSGNSMAATALVRLGKLTGRGEYVDAALGAMRSAVGLMQKHPTAAGQMLLALDMYLGPTPEIVILGELDSAATQKILQSLRQQFVPNKVVAFRSRNDQTDATRSAALDPMFAGRTQPLVTGLTPQASSRNPQSSLLAEPTVFICENFVCQAPVAGVEAVLAAWQRLR